MSDIIEIIQTVNDIEVIEETTQIIEIVEQGRQGEKGDAGLTVSVNNITQVNGNISITAQDIPETLDAKIMTLDERTKLAYSIPKYGTIGQALIKNDDEGYENRFKTIDADFVKFDSSKLDSMVQQVSGTTTNIYDIAYGNGVYVICGVSSAVLTSYDLITWTNRPIGVTGTFRNCRFLNGLFVGVGSLGLLATSPDGINWTSRTTNFGVQIRDVSYGYGLYIIVGANGKISTSPDTITWTQITSPLTTELLSTRLINGVLIAVGAGGKVITSTNGIDWTLRTSNVTGDLYAMHFNPENEKYIVTGKAGALSTSSDLITWTSINIGQPTLDIYGLVQIEDTVLAVTKTGSYLISTNMVNWAYYTGNVTTQIYNALYKDGILSMCGVGGRIFTRDFKKRTDAIIVSTTNPNIEKGLWIQTGLGAGQDFTFWIEDGE